MIIGGNVNIQFFTLFTITRVELRDAPSLSFKSLKSPFSQVNCVI